VCYQACVAYTVANIGLRGGPQFEVTPLSVVTLLNLRNAVQSAKSLPDVNKYCRSEFGSLVTNLQYFVTDYIIEIDLSITAINLFSTEADGRSANQVNSVFILSGSINE